MADFLLAAGSWDVASCVWHPVLRLCVSRRCVLRLSLSLSLSLSGFLRLPTI